MSVVSPTGLPSAATARCDRTVVPGHDSGGRCGSIVLANFNAEAHACVPPAVPPSEPFTIAWTSTRDEDVTGMAIVQRPTEVEWLALRRLRVEFQPGVSKERVNQLGPVLDPLQPFSPPRPTGRHRAR
jgi:hypothetical protein